MIASGGIALAVPSATVEDFLRNGARPRLGVAVQDILTGKTSTTDGLNNLQSELTTTLGQ